MRAVLLALLTAACTPNAVEIRLVNHTPIDVHLFAMDETMGPGNKVLPESERTLVHPVLDNEVEVFTVYAGRNGEILAEHTCPTPCPDISDGESDLKLEATWNGSGFTCVDVSEDC